ncbi:MAG: DUF2237 family protein [Calditrichia bacterium]
MAMNVLGTKLETCSMKPLTGFTRNGKCDNCVQDRGQHTVCAVMTEDFLQFSKEAGNDLSTPRLEYKFSGLKPGDKWCICLPRWIEAWKAGAAPKVSLKSTHRSVLEYVDLEDLKEYALDDIFDLN